MASSKILSPEKNIFVPTLESTCSLDLGCPASDLKKMKDQYPDRVWLFTQTPLQK